MRKILSIPLILLVLFSGITVSFATHFCGGYVAATKVSLTGEQATCGMEADRADNPALPVFTRHCCDNIISFYTLSSDYFLSAYFLNDPGQQTIQTYVIPAGFEDFREPLASLSDKIRPPGNLNPSKVELQVLCIYRI